MNFCVETTITKAVNLCIIQNW